MADDTPITIDQALAFEILDVLRDTPIYSLMGSDDEAHLGEDFKPHKWEGYELEHAEKAAETHRALLLAMQDQVQPPSE